MYHIAPGSVGAPSASSCSIAPESLGAPSESEPQVGPLPERRAQLAPQLEPTAYRVTYGTNARTNELEQDDSSEQTLWPRERRSRGPHARTSLGRRAGGDPPAPARDSDDRPPQHHQPARSEPDPAPCLRTAPANESLPKLFEFAKLARALHRLHSQGKAVPNLPRHLLLHVSAPFHWPVP